MLVCAADALRRSCKSFLAIPFSCCLPGAAWDEADTWLMSEFNRVRQLCEWRMPFHCRVDPEGVQRVAGKTGKAVVS